MNRREVAIVHQVPRLELAVSSKPASLKRNQPEIATDSLESPLLMSLGH
jgi:hypothetical protein